MTTQTFGERILKLRRKKGLTQRELADVMKCDFTYLSKIENDKVEPPSADFIRQLAAKLDGNAEELLDLANQFDRRALREVVNEMPEVAMLFRRLHRRQISREELIRFLEQNDQGTDRDADQQ